MDGINEMLAGVYAPMTTPFKNDEVFFEGFVENIKKMNKSALIGYFVCGTNGEFKSLTVPERLKLLEAAVKNASDDKVVMGGTAAESTRETIEITREACRIGVHLVSLLMPSFFKKIIDDGVMTDYVLEVAEASSVPVLLYNNPSVTGGVLVGPEVVKTVSRHPNVVGMKDSSKGNYQSYLNAVEGEFYLLAGSASFFLDLLKGGGIGGVLSLANVVPDACARLYRTYMEGSIQETEAINKKIVALNSKISGRYSVASVKAAMDVAGFYGGAPRKPLKPVSREEKQNIKNALQESGFSLNL
ncbi:MAG: dihydrodipicolinate synthase family protein [Spirochaetota bacterium]